MIISPLQGFVFGGYVNPGFRSLRSLTLGYKNAAPTELRRGMNKNYVHDEKNVGFHGFAFILI